MPFKIIKEVNDFDFINEYLHLAEGRFANPRAALGILYDFIDWNLDDTVEDMWIRDFIRYEVSELSWNQILEEYPDEVADYNGHAAEMLNNETLFYGEYDHEGEVYYLFNSNF